MDETTIATIERSKTSEIRVRLLEFHDKPYVDIRLFVVTDAVEKTPTRKGIALPPALVPDVIAALQAAEQEARAAGLIPSEDKVA